MVYGANKTIAKNLGASTGRVLGASIVKKNQTSYIFTGSTNYLKQNHYALKFFKNIWQKINYFTNKIISSLSF